MPQKPFLFRFMEPCLSPSRTQPDGGFRYDEVLDQVVTTVAGETKPVIEVDLSRGPATKKADIEKGDDQKDRWMWR